MSLCLLNLNFKKNHTNGVRPCPYHRTPSSKAIELCTLNVMLLCQITCKQVTKIFIQKFYVFFGEMSIQFFGPFFDWVIYFSGVELQELLVYSRWRGCGEKGTLLHSWWECKLVQPLWRTVWRFLKKTGNRTAL